MTRKHLVTRLMSTVVIGAAALCGCGSESSRSQTAAGVGNVASASAPAVAENDRQSAAVSGPHVPGYPSGEFPPVPLFDLPDLAMLDSSLGGFSVAVAQKVGTYPGLKVAPAACDQSGQISSGSRSMQLYGDGSGNYAGPDGTMHNYGDGSGSYSLNGVTVNVYGDGSGNYSKDAVQIHSYGDGSGNFTDGTTTIHLYGDGSGSYAKGPLKINIYSGGSGKYEDGTVSIDNYGDGSGRYSDPSITIVNYGDGTGTINGQSAQLKPIAPVQPLGKFPKMGTLKPISSCGTLITLSDGVLFDFGKHDLRPEAGPVLDSLASAMKELKVPAAQIGGHTDSISDDAFNQALSERRADAVVAALRARGVPGSLEGKGFGETKPVAPNELGGKDNPAGRQLNRRVEVFIKAFGNNGGTP